MESLKGEAKIGEGLRQVGNGKPRILVVGCGGGGCNTVNCLMNMGLDGGETVAINTDAQHLSTISADKKLLIGVTKGMGAGGDPAVGKMAAEMARPELEKIIDGADMVFLTVGMGGGTGTGAAPIIAGIAREYGAIVVGMVTMPFCVERARGHVAQAGLDELAGEVDTTIILDNNRLLDITPHLPLAKAFSVVDQVIAETIKAITDTITQPSLINLDYADVRTVMRSGGPSFIFVGEASLRNGPEGVVRSALKTPLIDVDCRGGNGCLLHITGGSDLTLKEAAAISWALIEELDPQANVIWGARIRRGFEGRARVVAVITGVRSAQIMASSTSRPEIKATR